MRTFCKLNTSFWTDELGRELRAGGPQLQVLALYLISNKHSNYTGIYSLPKMYIAADLGLDMISVDAMLRQLDEMNYAKYDESAEVIWVIDAAREQLGESLKAADKMVKAVQRELSDLPKKCVLTAQFIERYADAYHLKPAADANETIKAPAKVEAPATVKAPAKVEVSSTQAAELAGDLPSAIDWFIAQREAALTKNWLSDEQIASTILYMADLAPTSEVITALREADKVKDYDLRKLPAVFNEIYNDI